MPKKEKRSPPPMPELKERSPFELPDLILDLQQNPPTLNDGTPVRHKLRKCWTGKQDHPSEKFNPATNSDKRGQQMQPCSVDPCSKPTLQEVNRGKPMLWCSNCDRFHSWID